MGMGSERRERVWSNHDTDSLPEVSPVNEKFVDYLVRPAVVEAANQPFGNDVVAKGGMRENVVANEVLVNELSADLELAPAINLRPTFSADRDPITPTGSQIKTTREIYDSRRDNNLDRVTLPKGVPARAGGEITGSIKEARIAPGPRSEAVVGIKTGYSNAEVRAKAKATGSTWNRFKGMLGIN